LHIAVIRDSLLAAAAFQIRIVELNPATPAPMQPPAGSPATEENQGLAAPAIFGITIACLIGGLLILAAVLAVIRRVKEGKRASANIENSTMFEPLNDQSYIEVNAN
jgi:heme/copper-type cytochrome/quinol oxidase subunit 2